jgi:hypothetical protein
MNPLEPTRSGEISQDTHTPRGLAIEPDGGLYVAEAGSGGGPVGIIVRRSRVNSRRDVA